MNQARVQKYRFIRRLRLMVTFSALGFPVFWTSWREHPDTLVETASKQPGRAWPAASREEPGGDEEANFVAVHGVWLDSHPAGLLGGKGPKRFPRGRHHAPEFRRTAGQVRRCHSGQRRSFSGPGLPYCEEIPHGNHGLGR